ncbi:glycosyltransferase family 4 protein [Bradyrhizobium sp.]|uniref:glycosyltransferase family 4 protein n=1 Tax=Bradyrhizobium sp. TaxID=376 RepID=UPI0039E29B05
MAEDAPTSPYPIDLEMAAGTRKIDGARPSVYFDGVFKGDYSLAVVNRYLARALVKLGVDLSCFTGEADWQTDPLLNTMPDVMERMRSAPPAEERFDVHLRNTWPAATSGMIGRVNAYVCFAWEETEFPAKLVDRFNRDLDLVMVASAFVKRALVESGVTIPIEVVGEGADHVLDAGLSPPPIKLGRSRLLHVSSGFARKGVDCLIRAYHGAFTANDNVELVIKTFANPDNLIPRLVAELDSEEKLAPIRVIEASYSHAQLLRLYQTAHALVAPSRGEGFGLPLAEAMALEVPVVTTDYSGQVDFCRPDTAWLVDYTLSVSKAHVSGTFGLWAEPDVEDLGRQMKAVLREPDEALRRARRARTFVQAHLTWAKTARRTLFAVAKHRPGSAPSVSLPKGAPPKIDVVTSWGRNCGIATYAAHLYQGTVLTDHLSEILAQTHGEATGSSDDPRVSRIWGNNYQAMMTLAARLERGAADVLWMQHHPGHFSTGDMHALTHAIAKSGYRTRLITLHSVAEAGKGGSLDWCKAFETAFVHSASDAEALSRAGHPNPVVVPHGCLPASSAPERAIRKTHFDIGSFGFLTAHKNVDMLVRAFAMARHFTPNLRLHLFNCAIQDDRSRAIQAIVENLIRHFGLSAVVRRHYEFIPEQRLLSELSRCDLFVFPYGQTTETATGAARIALSANKPILCSQSGVLRDLHPVSHVLRELSVDCLAEALISLSQSSDLLSLYDDQRADFLRQRSYERAATRYLGHIMRSIGGGRDYRNAA